MMRRSLHPSTSVFDEDAAAGEFVVGLQADTAGATRCAAHADGAKSRFAL